MNTQVENMRGRTISGGFDNRPSATHGRYAPRDSGPLPVFVPKSILPDATLPITQFSQAPLNKSTLLNDCLFGGLLGIGFVVAGIFLLFVES
jgi:hypothetical protein